jgi:hypothetical protein
LFLNANLIIWQYDAFEIGFITTDDFTNADILEATYPAVAKRLHGDWVSDPAIPIITGFLGKVFLLPYIFNGSSSPCPALYIAKIRISEIQV